MYEGRHRGRASAGRIASNVMGVAALFGLSSVLALLTLTAVILLALMLAH